MYLTGHSFVNVKSNNQLKDCHVIVYCRLQLLEAMRPLIKAAARLWPLSRLHPPPSCIKRGLSSQSLYNEHRGFGICIDIDGVLLRGKTPISGATEAIKKITDDTGKFKYPVVFLTNSSIPEDEKAQEISDIFNVETNPAQFVMASSPLSLYKSFHKQKCLFLGQDNLTEMAKSLGFSNICTIEEVIEAFPLLDAISHKKRPFINEMSKEPPPPAALSWTPIEAIVLFTSPLQWETVLQVTTDLLLTQGDPRRYIHGTGPMPQIPMIVCNPDLQYMHASQLPRFGHGTFVLCLEELYKRLSGKLLEYRAILGKPSEASFRFAEHRLYFLSQLLGLKQDLKTMYMIGDNQEVDIVGGNMYHNYVTGLRSENPPVIPPCRLLPQHADLGPQNVKEVKSYLVKTGVYHEENGSDGTHTDHTKEHIIRSHRDFNVTPDLLTPYKICSDVNEAIEDIFERQNIIS